MIFFRLMFLCCFSLFALNYAIEATSTKNEALAPFEKVNSEIENALKIFHVPGAAIGIVVDGKIVFAKGYGFRDVTLGLPVTENTLFGLGSCTKAFTAFVLGQLVDENILSWDDPVIQFIPEFRLGDDYTTQHTTIRDLLTHRTGFSGHDFLAFDPNLTRKDLIDRIPFLEISDEFRKQFHYNNLMYVIAGHVVKRATSQSWEEVVRDKVFQPLGMKHSNFSLYEPKPADDFSLSYFYHPEEGFLELSPSHKITFIAPACGINSSISDMVKWVQLQLSEGTLNEKNLINNNTLRVMHSPQIDASGSFLPPISIRHYGLGWRIGSYKEHALVAHSGTMDGFQCQILLLPHEKIGVVVLTNYALILNHKLCLEKYFATSVSNMILDELFGNEEENWTQKLAEMYEQNKHASAEKIKNTPAQPNTSLDLQDYSGIYENPGYGLMRIELKKDQLIAHYGDISSPLLYQEHERFIGTEFAFSDKSFSFIRNASNKIHEVHVSLEPSVKPLIFIRKRI